MRQDIVRRRLVGVTALAIIATALVACGSDGGVSTPDYGTVNGLVLDGDGAPVAAVALALSRSGQSTRNATTGANGAFTFSQVEEGTWSLAVTAPQGYTVPGAQANPVVVAVAAGEAASVDITLAKDEVGPGDPAPSSITIVMKNVAFDPPVDTVAVGGTVTWRNDDGFNHNTTSDSGAWASANYSSGTFDHTFDLAGTYAYSCTLHSGMTGTIVVK